MLMVYLKRRRVLSVPTQYITSPKIDLLVCLKHVDSNAKELKTCKRQRWNSFII